MRKRVNIQIFSEISSTPLLFFQNNVELLPLAISLASTMHIRPITTNSSSKQNPVEKPKQPVCNLSHEDVSGPSLPCYSVDCLCWAGLGWVVASQGTSGDWLEPTRMPWDAASLSICFSLLSIPLSTLSSSNWLMRKSYTRGKFCQVPQKKKKSKASIKERIARPMLLLQDKKKIQKSLSLHAVEIVCLCFLSLVLFGSQLFKRISICYWAFVQGFMCPPTHFCHTTHPLPLLTSLFPISLSDKFFPPSHRTQPATPFVGVLV